MKKDLTTWGIDQADQIIDAIKTQMPLMTDAVIEVARYTALQHLVSSLILTILSVSLTYKFRNIFKLIHEWSVEELDGASYIFIIPIYTGLFGLFLHFGLFALCNVWNWIGIFQPKLYLAHEIIERVLK